jgi:hypothetical protein
MRCESCVVELLCLTNSHKGVDSYCFAGIDVDTLEWVRPIGSGWEGAVTADEQMFEDGSVASILDVVEVPVLEPSPSPGQPENWTLDDSLWVRTDRFDDEEALNYLESIVTADPLFGNLGKSLTPGEMSALVRLRLDISGGFAVVLADASRPLEVRKQE